MKFSFSRGKILGERRGGENTAYQCPKRKKKNSLTEDEGEKQNDLLLKEDVSST